MLPNLSVQLDIGDNYTRGQLSTLMGFANYPAAAIQTGVFSSPRINSVLIFSTIFNGRCWVNYKLDDTHFVYTADPASLPSNKELLLFIRKDQNAGFYYFGRCKFEKEIDVTNYSYKVCILRLLDTTFSKAIARLTPSQKDELREIGIT